MTERMAVLQDFPLRLWQRHREHLDTLLREFQLMVHGAARGTSSTPQELLSLAGYITGAHGQLIDQITEERHAALSMGRDRMDSYVPLLDELRELLDQVDAVLRNVDEFCRDDQLLLPRSRRLIAFADWTSAELRRQYAGETPRPWPGPF